MSFNKNDYLKKLSELFPTNDFYKFVDEIPEILTTNDKIPIWCKEHQLKFYKIIYFINKRHTCNCPICTTNVLSNKAKQQKCTISEQIEKWKTKFSDNITYEQIDLSLGTNYDNSTKIILTCPIHGNFITTVGSRRCGSGCLQCYREKQHNGINLSKEHKITTEMWLNRFKELYGDKYDYSLIKEIKNQNEKLPIICKEYGIFYKSAAKFYRCKQVCKLCNKKKGNKI